VPEQPQQAVLNHVHIHRFAVRGNLASGMKGEVQKYREFVAWGHWDIMVNHCLQIWSTDAILGELSSYPWASILVTHGLGLSNPRFEGYYKAIGQKLHAYNRWVRISSLTEEASFAQRFDLRIPDTITNGVDLEEWSRPPVGVRRVWGVGEAPWIVNVSNHCGRHHKNHAMFFELARGVQGLGARFTLVGNSHRMARWNLGSLGIRGGCFYECKARAMLSGSVELKCSAPREEVISAIKEADLLVSTSNWEANSLVLLESMAAGTPWVSTDVGSARANGGGIVVNNLDEMTAAVTHLLRDPDRRGSLGREGRRRAMERHDWVRIADQYLELYETTIGRRA
jgi:glycosyltransferase involved in cell wall biosynthesis